MGPIVMGNSSSIEWTATVNDDGTVTPGATWNPILAKRLDTGKIGYHCEVVGPECFHCYAATWNLRMLPARGTGLGFIRPNRDKVEIFLDDKMLTQPLHWKRPRKIFVCSMTDLFADFVPFSMIDMVFAQMAQCHWHTFQVLTKRAARMLEYFTSRNSHLEMTKCFRNFKEYDAPVGPWPLPNVWLGVSAGNQKYADERVPLLLQTPSAIRFVSYEPALGPIDFSTYLTHNPVHEIKEQRREDLSTGGSGTGDRQPRANMESSGETGRPMEWRLTVDTMRTQEGGERYRKVPSDRSDDQWNGSERLGTPAGVSALQGADPGGVDCESRGWNEEEKSSRQSHSRDAQGANGARYRRTENPQNLATMGHAEQSVQVDGRPSSADKDSSSGGGAAEFDSLGFWDQVPASVANSEGRPTISWLIVGGESGPGARPFDIAWARSVIDQCRSSNTACFVKQLGAVPIIAGGRQNHWDWGQAIGIKEAKFENFSESPSMWRIRLNDRKGGDMEEWPKTLRVREFPKVS